MNNPLDLFAWKLRTERKRQHLTQKALAERLHMSVRTIIEIEKCKSNPKFETVALLAKELNISLDAAIFPDMVTGTVSKTVVDSSPGKRGGDPEVYRSLQTGGDLPKRRITRSGLMCPAALLFYPIVMRANQSSLCEL